MYADSGDLGLAHPDARAFRNAACLDPEIRQSVDQGLLNRSHVGAHVALPFAQIQNGIADELAGPVIGDVTAAVSGMKGDAGAGQNFFARQKVFHVTVAAHGDCVGVLQKEQLVGNRARFALRHQPLLPFERVSILHAARFLALALKH